MERASFLSSLPFLIPTSLSSWPRVPGRTLHIWLPQDDDDVSAAAAPDTCNNHKNRLSLSLEPVLGRPAFFAKDKNPSNSSSSTAPPKEDHETDQAATTWDPALATFAMAVETMDATSTPLTTSSDSVVATAKQQTSPGIVVLSSPNLLLTSSSATKKNTPRQNKNELHSIVSTSTNTNSMVFYVKIDHVVYLLDPTQLVQLQALPAEAPKPASLLLHFPVCTLRLFSMNDSDETAGLAMTLYRQLFPALQTLDAVASAAALAAASVAWATTTTKEDASHEKATAMTTTTTTSKEPTDEPVIAAPDDKDASRRPWKRSRHEEAHLPALTQQQQQQHGVHETLRDNLTSLSHMLQLPATASSVETTAAAAKLPLLLSSTAHLCGQSYVSSSTQTEAVQHWDKVVQSQHAAIDQALQAYFPQARTSRKRMSSSPRKEQTSPSLPESSASVQDLLAQHKRAVSARHKLACLPLRG